MAEPTAQPTTSLTAFEQAVYREEYAPAMRMLIRMLEAIERGADFPSDVSDEADVTAYCTRFAAGIATLLVQAPDPLILQAVDGLAYHNRHITAIFRLSGYGDTGYLYRLAQGVRPDRMGQPAVARVLSTASVASPGETNWPELLQKVPAAASSAYLAQFSHRAPLTEAAEQRRDALLEFAPLLAGYEVRDGQIPLLCQAWMFCSYLTSPDRHMLKRTLNGLVANWLSRSGVNPVPCRSGEHDADRPTLVVVADVLMSWHAMFKTYAHFLKQLPNRFRLVLICLTGRVDEEARQLFDTVHEIPDTPSALREIVARIGEIGPDVLYYPSVGMSVLTVQLCNLRLAPMQIASVGHPATTNSPEIDYMVMGHTYYSEAAAYSERILLLQSTGALFEPTIGAAYPEPVIREKPHVLRIAISSSAPKLNATFLAVCRAIERSVEHAIEFHVFPNEQGIRHRDCASQIQKMLPHAIVHERTGYAEYLALLNRCDIRFGTFPFGGANTTMDAYLLGIPTITLAGAEPHSRTDARFVVLFELPDWLVAAESSEFMSAAARLIQDDAERITLSRRILDADPSAVLFEKEQSAYPTDFVDTVWWAHANHEGIQRSDRRIWSHADRLVFLEDKG